MRKTLLTLALVALLAMPVAAQFGGFGMGQADSAMLLSQKSVQDELKLTDEQKKAVAAANEDLTKALQKAREDMDFSGIRTAMEDQRKALKKVVDKLDEKQAKRLMQIEVQLATGKQKNPQIFANAGVQKALKLTTKQKDTTKETLSNLEKDVKEVLDDAQGDRQKFREAARKIGELRTESYTKIEKTLDDDQKKDFGKLGGEKFEMKWEFPGFGKKDKKEKEDKKEKKDDQ
jgi:hypothetical protein